MANNSIFNKVPIQVPNRSGFNEDSENIFTAMPGTLVPCHVDELNPGDTVTLGVSSQVQLPPMATDFYGRVRVHFETFFVPYRLLYGGWQKLITHPVVGSVYPSGTPSGERPKYLPSLSIPESEMYAGSLSDYLSVRSHSNPTVVPNPFRYLAYHMIFRHWYRNSLVQVDPFSDRGSAQNTSVHNLVAYFPQNFFVGDSPIVIEDSSSYADRLSLFDGVKIYSLRQRLWDKDYFTTATPLPQAGEPASVAFQVADGVGSFSIASLRQANSLQRWMEKNNIAGYDYWSQMYAQFGVTPPDYALDRPVYLGRTIFDVYNKSVYQSSPDDSGSVSSNNPFGSVGAKYGSPQGVGDGSLCPSFTAKEHGILMTIFSLVPVAVYDTATDRHVLENCMADFPFPELAGVGDQPIYNSELAVNSRLGADGGIFGYTQRYAHYKHKRDEVHGLMRSTNTLSSFSLKRTFADAPQLGSQFLEIPTTCLDEVAAVESGVSSFGCWVDAYFKYRKISTLPAYSIPTLGEPKDTHTATISPGGQRL